MHIMRSLSGKFLVPVTVIAAFAVCDSAHAFTCTWLGADSSMLNAANWSCAGGGPIPAAGDDLVFPASAPVKSVTVDYAPVPVFGNLTFDSGYAVTALPGRLTFAGTMMASDGHFNSIEGNGTGEIWGQPVTSGATMLAAVYNVPRIIVPGTPAPGPIYTILGGTFGILPAVTIGAGGRLSTVPGATMDTLDVQAGGSYSQGGPHPSGPAPATVSGGSVTSAMTMHPGSNYQYWISPVSYTTDPLTVMAADLGGANLVIAQGIAGADVPIGTQLALLQFVPGSLIGTFAGLPEGAIVFAGTDPSIRFRLSYGPDSGTGPLQKVTLTRVAAAPPPSSAPIQPVPALGPLAIAALAILLGIAGLHRRI